MGKLTGQSISSSYDQLLIVNDADGISSSLQAIESADTGGSSSSLKISTSKCEIIPASNSTSLFEVSKADGTAVLSVDTSNARVGIGTDSPGELLHLYGAIPSIRIEDSSDGIVGEIGNANNFITSAAARELGINAVTNIVFGTGGTTGTERMIIDSSGNVGIGVSSPQSMLHLSSGTDNQPMITIDHEGSSDSTQGGTLNFVKRDSDGTVLADNIVLGDIGFRGVEAGGTERSGAFIRGRVQDVWSDGDACGTELQFYTAETTGPGTQQRMCIQKDGRVGIGTSSPGAKLEVNGQVSAKIAEFENTTTGTGQDGIFVILKNDDVSSSGYWIALQDNAGADTEWGVRGDGSDNGATIYDASDRRLKDNIVDIADALSTVSKLKPRNFTWKSKNGNPSSGKVKYGFIADEYDEVFPDFVDGKRDSDNKLIPDAMKSDGKTIFRQMISEKPMIALLTKAIQELSAKVTALENA